MRTLILATALTVCSLTAASAFHFAVVRTTPTAAQVLAESPKRLQVWFSEAPSNGVSQILLKSGDAGVEVAKTVIVAAEKTMYAEPVKPLAPGAYTATWKGAGDDGHVLTGEIKFTVKPGSQP